jgi:hypothetical protein
LLKLTKEEYTFSNFNSKGASSREFTSSKRVSLKSKASERLRFLAKRNTESVSPYMTLQSSEVSSSMVWIVWNNKFLAVEMMASAMSPQGIRPENPAAVYPYITFMNNFKAFC